VKDHIQLGPGPEFDRVRAILAALGDAGAPSGDDVALLSVGGRSLALSTDLSIEGTHFLTDWLSLEEIGWRSAAAALSDLAAVGATPLGVLVALGVPADASDADAAALMRGVGRMTAEVDARVLGGDLSKAPAWTVAVTVIGEVAKPSTRSGGRPGDLLYVTGELGGAHAALQSWLVGKGQPVQPEARERFAHPLPRIAAGRALSASATAMMDLSDGLASDIFHLAAASNCGAVIELDALPVSAAAIAFANGAGKDPALFAAEGGEDYELLVALPPELGPPILNVKLTRIGRLVAGDGVQFLSGSTPVFPKGFQHFR
jgi:thiamine-monophosphate kinase